MPPEQGWACDCGQCAFDFAVSVVWLFGGDFKAVALRPCESGCVALSLSRLALCIVV